MSVEQSMGDNKSEKRYRRRCEKDIMIKAVEQSIAVERSMAVEQSMAVNKSEKMVSSSV